MFSKKHKELMVIGEALDNGVGSVPDDIWKSYVEKYHKLQIEVFGKKKIEDQQ